MSSTAQKHWNSVAREWCHFGPPLRPCEDDIRFTNATITEHRAGKSASKALLCGITPELARMSWPTGTVLTAVERSEEMIHVVWPGDIPGERHALLGDWIDFEAHPHTFDLIVGDGCFALTDYPRGSRALAARLATLLKNDGLLVMRFFVHPVEKESPDRVLSDLAEGKIGSFHAFKWRLVMSLQDDPNDGVCLRDIHAAWKASGVDREKLFAQTGWTRAAINTIELYENKPGRMFFLQLTELLAVLEEYFFIKAQYTPRYELGDRCPTLVLAPRITAR